MALRILVLNVAVPFPPIGGAAIRTYHLLQSLAKTHEVTLVAFTYDEKSVQAPPFPLRLIAVPWQWPQLYREMLDPDDRDRSRVASDRLTWDVDEPWFASVLASDGLEHALDELAEEPFDLVLIEHADMARFIDKLPIGALKVLDFHNVYSLMAQRAAESTCDGRQRQLRHEAERTIRYEHRSASACALSLTCSEVDASAVRRLLGIDRVSVVPNGVDTAFFSAADGEHCVPRTLLFTGILDYEPNVDAVVNFVRAILPLIRARVPDVTFEVAGANPTAEVLALAGDGVTVHGSVPDMRPYYERAEVVVVPLREGGGTRLKILEAGASGKAIVTTAVGVEGLDLEDGEDLIVADSPQQFAEAVVSLIENDSGHGRRRQLERAARAAVLRYDWNGIGRRFCQLIETLGST